MTLGLVVMLFACRAVFAALTAGAGADEAIETRNEHDANSLVEESIMSWA